MLMFLDVVSSLPEFFIIEDNKVIFQRKIIENESDKLSDNIFQTYIKMSKNLNLNKNLKKIVLTIGPGSYTSLRLGAAFVSGLKLKRNILFCPITIDDIFKFKFNENKNYNFCLFISSSNNQDFLCTIDSKDNIQFIKIDNDKYTLTNYIKTIYYNEKPFPLNNKKKLPQLKFSFVNEIINNQKALKFSKNSFIKPIYISNNEILN